MLGLLAFNSAIGQEDGIKKDISDALIRKMFIPEDGTPETAFRNFAVRLFLDGKPVNSSILKDSNRGYAGIALLPNDDTLSPDTTLTLVSMRYRYKERITDFHKRIYYGGGGERLICFRVLPDGEDAQKMIDEAIDQYLMDGKGPIDNQAYQYATTYVSEDPDHAEKFFNSDGKSTVLIAMDYGYLRRSGNYLVKINGTPDRELDSDSECLWATDQFINKELQFAVYVIDDNKAELFEAFRSALPKD